MARRISPLRDYLSNESSSGLLLLAAAVIGFITANSPFAERYFELLDYGFTIDIPGIFISLTILKVINYCLMTIFFFVVGLEIKRELTSGHLSQIRQAAAPFFAAIGGMALPALIYLAIAGRDAPEGWAVPVATDIALAVGVLALMGSRASQGVRTFLLALAVIDDIGAILIIAIIYSTGILFSWIAASAIAILIVFGIQRMKVNFVPAYFFLGVTLWYCLYKAGVHPTLAGVIMGLLTPAVEIEDSEDQDLEDGKLTVVEKLENRVHPFSSFIVVPLFAFANAGIAIDGSKLSLVLNSAIAWGIFLGLTVGKPLGILMTSLLVSRVGIAEQPEGSSNARLLATGSAAGIGFTVAIFIAKLAFKDPAEQDLAILAVIAGSIFSGLLCALLFRTSRGTSPR